MKRGLVRMARRAAKNSTLAMAALAVAALLLEPAERLDTEEPRDCRRGLVKDCPLEDEVGNSTPALPSEVATAVRLVSSCFRDPTCGSSRHAMAKGSMATLPSAYVQTHAKSTMQREIARTQTYTNKCTHTHIEVGIAAPPHGQMHKAQKPHCKRIKKVRKGNAALKQTQLQTLLSRMPDAN